MSVFGEIKAYLQFAWRLRGFLKTPITLEYSRELIKQRLLNRETNLLTLVKNAIYDNTTSPYLQLLKLAGCEYGDFEKMVHLDGIEAALTKLRQKGVYISIDEFKGKKPVKRGSRSLSFNEADFDNPFIAHHLKVSTDWGAGRRLYYDLNFLAEGRSVYLINQLYGWHIQNIPLILWNLAMPGPGPMELLHYAKAGQQFVRWYSPIQGKKFKPSLKNRFGTTYIIYAGRLFGTNLPRPEYVSIDKSWKIAEYVSTLRQKFGGCYIHGSASRAIALCRMAKERGIDITGTKFSSSAEPITESKRQEIELAGASIYPKYIFTEGGYVGYGCFNPEFADEIHFFKDALALIQYEADISSIDRSINPFLFTSLLPSTPKVLLNVENGDYGTVTPRKCGCYFEQLGFTDHIHSIRSFEKFTIHGMTLFGVDMIRIVEKVLPDRFGGTSIDYQILEEEDKDNQTYMTIVARPELGELDENEIIRVVLGEIRKGNDAYRMAAEMWSQTKAIRVRRMNPVTTPGAKLLPVYTLKAK
jgi:hypothetical protein